MTQGAPVNPWLAILLVGGALAALMALIAILKRTASLEPETARKLFHLGGGGMALALPWVFEELWPVVTMAIITAAALLVLRLVPALRAGPGQVLHAVGRKSYGEFWFLVGIVAIFLIARDDVVIYSIGVLILAVADSAAALVGVVYGLHHYKVPGGTKSAEGSIAMFLVAFLCVQIPLLLFSDVGRPELLLISINIALLLSFGEANVAHGADNAILPIAVVVLLDMYWELTATVLLGHTAVIVALGVSVVVFRNRSTLSPDALMGAVIANYVYWAFGDWRFLVPPVVVYMSYTWLVGWPKLEERKSFHADVLLAVALPGLAFVTIYAETGHEILYLMFAACYAAILASLGTLHWKLRAPDDPPLRIATVSMLKGLLVLVPGVLVAGYYPIAGIAAAVVSVPLTLLLFALTGRELQKDLMNTQAWLAMPLSVMLGTILGFVVVSGGFSLVS